MSSYGSLLPPLTIAAAPWGAVSGEDPREHEGSYVQLRITASMHGVRLW
jgi:hypothetical protein